MRNVALVLVGMALVATGVAFGRYAVPSRTSAQMAQVGRLPTTTTHNNVGTTTTTNAVGNPLPIVVQPVSAQDTSSNEILVPTSCTISGSTVTATGNYSGPVSEGYRRAGDVVELYVYTAPLAGYSDGIQQGLLSAEKPPPLGTGPWAVTVPIDPTLGTPDRCAVAIQPTHQFENAPSAY